jgi:uncharacterized protein YjbI with pentapeptide repeats
LSGANLRDANLSGAYLSGAYLSGAIGILTISPIGSRGDMLVAVIHKDCVMVKTGCFWGTMADFKKAVSKTHKRTKIASDYKAAISLIETWAKGQKG